MQTPSTEQHEDWKRLVLSDPALFIVTYFPDRIEKLEPFHLTLLKVATEERLGLVLFPAGHGKTTLISELLPIWAICRNPNIRIALIAKNDIDAQSITRSIQTELATNERLIRDFGPFKSDDPNKAWALSRFDVAARTKRGKSATFAAFGARSRNALGYRTDWIICDDVVTDQNSNTPEQRFKLREWFNQGPKTSADDMHARLTVVGTLFHPEDLYHDLLEMTLPDTGASLFSTERFSAVLDWDKQEVLWPDKRPWMWLMEQKASMGTLDFQKRYMNVAVDPSRMVFRHEHVWGGWIGKMQFPGCVDKSYVVGEYDPTWRKFVGFDPAVGVTKNRKFCAHLTLAVGSCPRHERCFWVVDLYRDQLTLPQQVELIISKHREYDVLKSVVEANSYQAGLYQAIKQKLDENGEAMAVEPHYTTRTNKPDPELGVQAMAPWFENGKVHIPWGNPESQRKMSVLVDELVQYPSGRTTDTVMAFWIAWLHAQQGHHTFQSFNRLPREAPTWAKRLGRRVVTNPAYT
jgi:phage terminase large subunit-like protein